LDSGRELVNDVSFMMSAQAKAAGVELRVNIADGNPALPVDTPSVLAIQPWVTVHIQGYTTYLTGNGER
jgi:hypothetical protein